MKQQNAVSNIAKDRLEVKTIYRFAHVYLLRFSKGQIGPRGIDLLEGVYQIGHYPIMIRLRLLSCETWSGSGLIQYFIILQSYTSVKFI